MADIDLLEKELLRLVQDRDGQAYVRAHLERYRKTIALIPTDRQMEVLDLGTFLPLAALLKQITPHSYTWHVHGRGEEREKEVTFHNETYRLYNFDVEAEPFPFPAESFDLVLCAEVLEHLGLDPFFMLSEINRVTKPNGLLLLTTPNVTSARNTGKMLLGYSPYLYASFTLTHDRHNREYSPGEIASMLTKSGFAPEQLFTSDIYFPSSDVLSHAPLARRTLRLLFKLLHTSQLRGDAIFALARKVSAVIERYPEQFYDIRAFHP